MALRPTLSLYEIDPRPLLKSLTSQSEIEILTNNEGNSKSPLSLGFIWCTLVLFCHVSYYCHLFQFGMLRKQFQICSICATK